MRLGKLRSYSAGCLLASLAALPSAAHAQSAVDGNDHGEIVVTAQKRKEGINDVPITISAFSGTRLNDAGINGLNNLAAITPGLTVTDTSANGVPIYTIRGVGFSDYSTSASSTVGIYADEVALPYAVMTRGVFFDTQQVEVLKGPQGDLYGRNSTAGQININSARPTDTFKAGASADVSNYGETNVEGYVSGPVVDGLTARLAGKVSEGGAWQHSISRPDDRLGNKDVMAVRGSLDWKATPNLDVFVSGHYIVDRSDNQAATAYSGTLIGESALRLPAVTTTAAGSPTSAFSVGNDSAADWGDGDLRPRRDNRLAGFVAKANLDLSVATLSSVTGYDRFTRHEANDGDGWAGNDGNSINDTHLSVFSQELRLASKESGPLTWIVGGYYSHDVMHENYHYYMQQSFYALALGIQTLDTRYDQITTSLAGFAHAEYRLGDGWRVLGGIRYTHEKRTWSGCTYDSGDGTLAQYVGTTVGGCGTYDDIPGTPGYGTYAVFTDTIGANKPMWKVGIDKKIGRELVYATVSNAFKSGGFSGINTNLASQLLPYGPETVTAYELGSKLSLAGNRIHVDAAAFWYDYRNKQESDYINTFVGALVQLTNVPRSRVRGAEVDGHWQVTPELSLDGSATYLDAVITDWPGAGVDSGNVAVATNLAGARLANSPRWQTMLAGAYEKAIGRDTKAFVALDMNSRTATSGRVLALDPSTGVAGYTLVNGRIGIKGEDGKWQVALWMRNIANRYYYTAAFAANSTYVRMNGMPRTFGLSARHDF
jgi:iron complex outermembrane recepter protein